MTTLLLLRRAIGDSPPLHELARPFEVHAGPVGRQLATFTEGLLWQHFDNLAGRFLATTGKPPEESLLGNLSMPVEASGPASSPAAGCIAESAMKAGHRFRHAFDSGC